jgi:hypothetical protein
MGDGHSNAIRIEIHYGMAHSPGRLTKPGASEVLRTGSDLQGQLAALEPLLDSSLSEKAAQRGRINFFKRFRPGHSSPRR